MERPMTSGNDFPKFMDDYTTDLVAALHSLEHSHIADFADAVGSFPPKANAAV